MSAPFVHFQSQQTPYYYPSQPSTPFIPDVSLYPHSPYSNPPSLPGSPNLTPASIPFPQAGGFDGGYIPWDPYVRERRPSWHANNNPWPYTDAPLYPVGAGLNRRHSFGAAGYPTPPTFLTSPPYVYPQFQINPWIRGDFPRPDFTFDLSSPFSPMRTYGPGHIGLLAQDELIQPATNPPITKLRIVCDAIPQWPLELQPNAHMTNPYLSPGMMYQIPPIALGDVLVAIHMHLQRRITHADWAKLTHKEMVAVGRAYTERCRNAPQGTAEHELAQGVKRVDFLLGRTKMVGLVRQQPLDGWEIMKLRVKQ